MIGFHRHRIAARLGRDRFATAASLRAAAIDMIRSGAYAHPFYWAAYIVAGSPD